VREAAACVEGSDYGDTRRAAFNSIAGWLPEDEASALRAAFQCEINRLYIIAETDDKAVGGSNEKYSACGGGRRWPKSIPSAVGVEQDRPARL